MKNIYKIVLGIAGTGAIVSTGVITANKIIDNKGENKMSNTVEVISELNVNEQDDKNIIENQVEQVENVTEETPEVDNQVKESEQKVNQTVPIQNEQVTESSEPVVEQEKKIICKIPIVGVNWENDTEFKLDLNDNNIYAGTLIDRNKDIEITINGIGVGDLKLYVNGVLKAEKMVDFNGQTSITIP
ncbi:MAG: hypothetical protein J6K45_04735 [Clostridia bacterium]|nr:hypothetical protein [Clostridia bacterium]